LSNGNVFFTWPRCGERSLEGHILERRRPGMLTVTFDTSGEVPETSPTSPGSAWGDEDVGICWPCLPAIGCLLSSPTTVYLICVGGVEEIGRQRRGGTDQPPVRSFGQLLFLLAPVDVLPAHRDGLARGAETRATPHRRPQPRVRGRRGSGRYCRLGCAGSTAASRAIRPQRPDSSTTTDLLPVRSSHRDLRGGYAARCLPRSHPLLPYSTRRPAHAIPRLPSPSRGLPRTVGGGRGHG